jgi:hypothetical protein
MHGLETIIYLNEKAAGKELTQKASRVRLVGKELEEKIERSEFAIMAESNRLADLKAKKIAMQHKAERAMMKG